MHLFLVVAALCMHACAAHSEHHHVCSGQLAPCTLRDLHYCPNSHTPNLSLTLSPQHTAAASASVEPNRNQPDSQPTVIQPHKQVILHTGTHNTHSHTHTQKTRNDAYATEPNIPAGLLPAKPADRHQGRGFDVGCVFVLYGPLYGFARVRVCRTDLHTQNTFRTHSRWGDSKFAYVCVRVPRFAATPSSRPGTCIAQHHRKGVACMVDAQFVGQFVDSICSAGM